MCEEGTEVAGPGEGAVVAQAFPGAEGSSGGGGHGDGGSSGGSGHGNGGSSGGDGRGNAPQPMSPSRCTRECGSGGLPVCPGAVVDGARGVHGVGKLFHLLALHLPHSWQMPAQPLGCLGALVLIPRSCRQDSEQQWLVPHPRDGE